MKNLSLVMCAMLVAVSTVFVGCNHSSKTVEDKVRGKLSTTRFMQRIMSTTMTNNLLERQLKKFNFTDGTTRESIIANGVPCEWIIPAKITSENVLLYIHGGGFAIGLTPGHLQMAASLAEKMGIKVLMVDYRLSPKYPFPAALEDCVNVYNWLLTQNISPNNIVIAGDSAGGNLTITTLLKLKELNIPLPVAAATLSPVVNLVPKANYKEGYRDPLLHPKAVEYFNTSYTGAENPKNPLISPFFADLRGLPPILVHIAEDEALHDNAVNLFRSAKEAGANVIYEVYPKMWHVWQLYAELPQTAQSLNEIAEFLTLNLSAQEVFKNSDLTISKLEHGVWVVETTDMATMYIVEGTERAMLIDTGTQCEKLDEVIRKITNKPLIVVLTHYHPDHAGNIRYFDEVYMHPLDTAIKLDIEFNGKFRWLQDGDVFDLGNRKIEVAWLPGHTPGSIVLLDRTINAAYIGDTYGSGQVWLHLRPTSPMKTYYESCVRMEKIMHEQNITKLYVGHYPLFKRPLTLNYIVDMKDLAKRLSEGNTNGSTPYKMPFQTDLATDNPAVITNGTVRIVFDPKKAN